MKIVVWVSVFAENSKSVEFEGETLLAVKTISGDLEIRDGEYLRGVFAKGSWEYWVLEEGK